VTQAADRSTAEPLRVASPDRLGGQRKARRTLAKARVRRATFIGWLFVLPAVVMYAVFVLQPLLRTVEYSFYRWDGVGPSTWVGLTNYQTVLTDPVLTETLFNAFRLIFFFSVLPVVAGLIVASIIRRSATGLLGTAAKTVLFLPQVIPLVAAGIVWNWVLSLTGVFNQALTAFGAGGITRAWLGDFDFALPAVGVIGFWVLLGLCTVLLFTGMGKIDPGLYEAARIDGASAVNEFFAITVPSLRNEIVVCLTDTIIAALASFDIVYISTGGGPGRATMVPGLQIYTLAFFGRQIGVASALAVVLVVIVLLVIFPLQRLNRGSST
jgi:raffinose/stachyose/melibiose transport system permease protein